MVAQARVIAAWGNNVYVKLPVTTTRGEPLFDVVRSLSRDGVKVNMTAIFAGEQVARAVEALDGGAPACVSVFAGRLADLGIDYRPIMQDAIARARKTPNIEIIWASTREVFNVVEADAMGCHIITAPADVLKKLPALGTKTAAELSLGAVKVVPRGRAGRWLAAFSSRLARGRIGEPHSPSPRPDLNPRICCNAFNKNRLVSDFNYLATGNFGVTIPPAIYRSLAVRLSTWTSLFGIGPNSQCRLYPRKQTFARTVATSALCHQKRTPAHGAVH